MSEAMGQATMRFGRFLVLALLAIVASRASASRADDAADSRPFFYDAKHHLRFGAGEDSRTLVITDDTGGYLAVFDPLFDGDGGYEGTITAIRLATRAEMRNFRRDGSKEYVVLSYSAGGLIVVSMTRDSALRPLRCGETSVAIVARNIACRLDLAEAKVRYLDALNERFLTDGPSTITPISVAIPCSDIILHVEADGRTVWAEDKSGARLWTEDPFERGGLKPYRVRRPIIFAIFPPATKNGARCRNRRRPTVQVSYNSSQFGELDARTGQFVFFGQD